MGQKMDLWHPGVALSKLGPALAMAVLNLAAFQLTLHIYMLNYNTSFAVPVAVVVSGCRTAVPTYMAGSASSTAMVESMLVSEFTAAATEAVAASAAPTDANSLWDLPTW